VARNPGTALITGGTGGLGVAVVDEFLAHGWRVVVPWVNERELERVPDAGRPGGRERLELIQADLFERESVEAVVELASSKSRAPLRAVANLVGGFAMGARVHETPIDDFEQQLRLNLRPAYLVAFSAIPALLESGGGAMVLVSSRAAVQPFPRAAGYITSKAAVLAFAKALSAEYRDDGIRVNAVLPSVIATPAALDGMSPEQAAKAVPPEEIASVVRFLCSNDSAPISGAEVPVYGRA
jgi:NAD(P)-dependent dehydrogenase (short-subunit alcohol dehydrogenase family)